MGKTIINEDGYLEFKDTGKLVHRWIAEKKYGKEKVKQKIIHHLDGNKINNSKDNLIIIDSKEDHYLIEKYASNLKKYSYKIKKHFYPIVIIGFIIQFMPILGDFVGIFLISFAIYTGLEKRKE
jgi:hypothetical protein